MNVYESIKVQKKNVERRCKAHGAGYTGKGRFGEVSRAEESDSQDQ